MSHIIILDRDGNEIGREDHGTAELDALAIAEDHEPRIVRLDLEKIAGLMHEAKKGPKSSA